MKRETNVMSQTVIKNFRNQNGECHDIQWLTAYFNQKDIKKKCLERVYRLRSPAPDLEQ